MSRSLGIRSNHRAAAALAAATLAAGIIVAAGACAPGTPTPPSSEFLVATPDSAFWVRTGVQGVHVRSVPMTLAHYGGRFHEVYVADVDRSFSDAVFDGERVYVRDLQTGDSSLVYDDTAVVKLAAQHARAHPDAVPLGPDDDSPDDPAVTATGETDVVEVRGPYVLLEHRSAFEHDGGSQHDTVRTAVDLRTGRAATSASMARDLASDDPAIIDSLPTTWSRAGYTLLARGDTADGSSVSLVLRDRAMRSWPLFTVSARPRLYWLDAPPVDARTRHALARAFDAAATYDEMVKYVRFSHPLPQHPPARPQRHA